MTEKVFQILYCSRNNIRGTGADVEAEVSSILSASQKNNALAGVTGALFYNTVFFGQVLEGNFADVQRVFERLQVDPRHSDLVVLESGYVPQRDFHEWSMAFVGMPVDFTLPFALETDQAAHKVTRSASGDKTVASLRELVAKQQNWALPERPSAVRPMATMQSVA